MTALANNGSGKTDWYGSFGMLLAQAFSGQVFSGLNVTAQASPIMSVKVNPGTALIPYSAAPTDQAYLVRLDTVGGSDQTITTANGSNPRNDLIVAYYDITVIDASNPNNPGALKFKVVAGTPASTPADPNAGAIQTAVGASNPYIILARVLVGTSVTQITTGNITDLRTMTSAVPDNTLVTAKYKNGSVTADKLATGATSAFVATSQTTASTTYADLATTTDTVTVVVGANGVALVNISSYLSTSAAAGQSVLVGIAVSGANTIAAANDRAIQLLMYTSGAYGRYSGVFLYTGLTPGSTTFKMKYSVTSGTGTFADRRIGVVAL